MKTPPALPGLPQAPAAAKRPTAALSRFRATLYLAALAVGIGPDEASFLADLRAVVEYVTRLELSSPGRVNAKAADPGSLH